MPCTNEEGKNTLPGQVLVACVRDKNMTQFLPDFWDNRLRMLNSSTEIKDQSLCGMRKVGIFITIIFSPLLGIAFYSEPQCLILLIKLLF